MPVEDRPSLQVIEHELEAYRRFWAAAEQGIRPLPEVPEMERVPRSMVKAVLGEILHIGLKILGRVAKYLHFSYLRGWASRQRVSLDRFTFEPTSCGLNRALTEMGLALLATGEVRGAKECLVQSWQVHPCIHNTYVGLDFRLWQALQAIPDLREECAEYERMAKKFCPMANWPLARI